MTNFFQLFIYGNGEVGLVKELGSPEVQVPFSGLTKVEPLIEYVKSFRPEGVVERDFLLIAAYKSGRLSYVDNDPKNQLPGGRIKRTSDTEGSFVLRGDINMIRDLVDEILSVLPQE